MVISIPFSMSRADLQKKCEDWLVNLCNSMKTEGRLELVREEHSNPTINVEKGLRELTVEVVTPNGKKTVKMFEGDHLLQFLYAFAPTGRKKSSIEVSVTRSTLDSALSDNNRTGGLKSLRNISSVSQMEADYPESILTAVAQSISENTSIYRAVWLFFKFCYKEHRPIRFFESRKDMLAAIGVLEEYVTLIEVPLEKPSQDETNHGEEEPQIPYLRLERTDKSSPQQSFQYVDLFDDALYRVHDLDRSDIALRDQLNALRYQVFLAILFDKTLIVPEQWAVSSGTFLQVVGEMLDGLEGSETILIPEKSGPPSFASVKPPLCVSYIDRKVSSETAYFSAFADRLENGRRIQLSPELSNLKDVDEYSLRAKMLRFLNRVRDDGQIRSWERFQFDLEPLLGSAQSARNMRNLCRYLATFPNSQLRHHEQSYRHRIAKNVVDVEFAVQAESLRDIDGEMAEFRDFFSIVKREQIPLDQIMTMQDILPRYSEEGMGLIQKMGRFVMHSAMADNIGASLTTSFSNGFDPLNSLSLSGPYDQLLVEQIRKSRRLNSNQIDFLQPDLSIWTVCANAQLQHNNLNWRRIWESVWGFALSENWRQLKKEMARAISPLDPEQAHEHEIWHEIFSAINIAADLFHIAVSETNPSNFIVTLPLPLGDKEYTPIAKPEREKLLQEAQSETMFQGPLNMLARNIIASIRQNTVSDDIPSRISGLEYPNI